MIKKVFFFCCFIGVSQFIFAQNCEDIFPDAASNTRSDQGITLFLGSQIINSPDGILATDEFNDNTGGISCDGSPCSASGQFADTAEFSSFPSDQPDITLADQTSQSVTEGSFENLTLGSEAVLTMAPGVYVFRGEINLGASSEIIVASAGTVAIFVSGHVTLESSAVVNLLNGSHNIFLYSRRSFTLEENAVFNGLVFARNDGTLENGASITGALTTRGSINLRSASTITYDESAVSTTDYNDWCTAPEIPSPTLIAEWKFDEGSGQIAADSTGGVDFALGSNISGVDANDPNWVCGVSGTALDFNDLNGEYAEAQSSFTPPDIGTLLFWITLRAAPTVGLGLTRPFSLENSWETRVGLTGRLRFDINTNSESVRTDTALSDFNRWYHIGFTYNSDTDEWAAYVDGELDNSGSNFFNSVAAGTLNLGRRTWTEGARYFNGALDEFQIYEGELSQAQVQSHMNASPLTCNLPVLDQFEIEIGAGNASVCEPFEVTIIVRDDNGAVLTGYDGTIELTTSTSNGSWAISDGEGTLVDNGSGSAEYRFEGSGLDQGQVVLSLDNARAETLTVTVAESRVAISSTSSNITFSENAFVISENDFFGEDLIAGRDHQFTATLMEQAPSGFDGDDCSVASGYNESSVRAWHSRSAADPGGNAPSITNAAETASLSLASTEGGSQSIALNFSAGQANFSLSTSDVGQYSLELYDDSLNFSDQVIRGGSNVLSVRPFAFKVSAVGNPEATDEAGAVYLAAGELFDVSVEALGWHEDDDQNTDGAPDNENAVLNGAVLASFGQESPPESVSLSSSSYAPSGGVLAALVAANGSSTVASSFSSGSATASDLYYSEVGIIKIEAQLSSNYLGASASDSAKATSFSNPVGRFVPSYFEVLVNDFAEACGSFSYLAQPRSLNATILAKNASGGVTQNYQDGFSKLSSSQGSLDFGVVDGVVPTLLSDRLLDEGLVLTWSDGEGALSTEITLERELSLSVLDGPYENLNFGLVIADTDGVSLRSSDLNLDSDNSGSDDMFNIGSGLSRFGRLILPDAHGPESSDLRGDFFTQYWNGSAWTLNTDDSCTQISAADISLPTGSIDTLSNLSVSVGAGSSTASFFDLSAAIVNFSAGDAGLAFSAPGAGNTGVIDVAVDIEDYPWLHFDWNGSGLHDDLQLPTAEFSFGSYRGHDRVIYWRERLTY